jgi:pimeloyl-ACP methyl ester carboxylesterase
MPSDRSTAPDPAGEPWSGDAADGERFVFGDQAIRERWWGRPVAETRGWLELGRLLGDPVFYGAGVPHGDGRPVVLMPGFLAGDQTLVVLAGWLRRLGYRPRLCGFVANTGCSDRTLNRVERRVESLWQAYGRRVALIGHSRGGHFARALAARRPDRVSHAISMGGRPPGSVRRQRSNAVRSRRCTPRRPRQRTSTQRRLSVCPLWLSIQPRLRAEIPVRAGVAHQHLFKG